jgi:alkylation response protein AidB-like acyl-CoA dehydrogenase
MRFHYTTEEEAFRRELLDFLDRELPPDWEGSDAFGEEEGDEQAAWEFRTQFTRKLADRGWLAMAWPKEYGGLGASHMQQLIYNEVMSYHNAPGAFSMGVAWVGPAVMLYGTDEQKRAYVPRIASGEDVWCTLYSEPAAGSDLAALQARAVLDGDDFVINGQKVWTSNAHRSQWGWLAARTNADVPKHKGISTFVVDMRTPGVTIRPLINMAGMTGFSEVFFDDVRIPKESLVGELNRGWYQVAVALDFERSGIQTYAGVRRILERLVAFVRGASPEVTRNPQVRLRLADRAVELEVGTFMAYRVAWMQSRGLIPNYEASISKVYGSELAQRVALTGSQLVGIYGGLWPGTARAPLGGRLARSYVSAVGTTIAAGTSEIMRNIIAQRGLGLPRD